MKSSHRTANQSPHTNQSRQASSNPTCVSDQRPKRSKRSSLLTEKLSKCQNHSDVAASHYLQTRQNQRINYCEKCSIKLASQGFYVIKMVNDRNFRPSLSSANSVNRSTSHTRKQQVQSFLSDLQFCYQELENKCEVLYSTLMESENEFGKMIQKANIFYDQIQEMVDLQKYLTYNHILTQRTEAESEVRQLRLNIKGMLAEIEKMGTDIIENQEIVESVQAQMYSSIMQSYHEKLARVSSIMDIQKVSIESLVINIPDVPSILEEISNAIEIGLSQKFINEKEQKQRLQPNTAKFSYTENSHPVPIQKVLFSLDQQERLGNESQTSELYQRNHSQNNNVSRNVSNLQNWMPAEEAFSFQSSETSNNGTNHKEQNSKVVKKEQQQEMMMLKDSFSLTSINENEEYYNRNLPKGSCMKHHLNGGIINKKSIGQYFMYDSDIQNQCDIIKSREQAGILLIQ